MTCEEQLRAQPIKRLLLSAYCGTACCVFVVVLTVSVISIWTLQVRVLDESTDALRHQVFANSGHVLREGGEVFDAKLTTGFQSLVLPVAYAVADVYHRGAAYSVNPSRSYSDSSWKHLRPDVVHQRPFICSEDMPQAEKDRRGCSGGLRAISKEASACYLTGFPYDDDGVPSYSYPSASDDILNARRNVDIDADGVRASAVIDDFVKVPYENSTGWNGAWVALRQEGSLQGGTSQAPLFRTYPGYVQDLSHNVGNNRRIYDPTNRPWYTDHQTGSFRTMLEHNDVGQYQAQVTGPYLDAFGNGYLLTTSAAITQGNTLQGVAGNDYLVKELKSLVDNVKIRQTGTMHLYHIPSDNVTASPQWSAEPTDPPMRASQIKLDTVGASAATLPIGSCNGEETVDEHLVIRRSAWNGEYCLVAVVPVSEVVAPIEDQRAEIESTGTMLIMTVVAIILACFFFLVMPCTVLLSLQLSKPLAKTSDQSRIIARNIGGDLLKDVWVDDAVSSTPSEASVGARFVRAGEAEQKRCLDGGIGEVTELRGGFINVLAQLQAKRNNPTTAEYNPLYGKVIDPPDSDNADPNAPHNAIPAKVSEKIGSTSVLGKAFVDSCDPVMLRKVALMEIPKLGWWNRISNRLVLQLVLPLCLALLLIVVLTSVLMFTKADEWIQPVKEMMIAEELSTLDIRTAQRGDLVQETLSGSVKTLLMIQAYAAALYSPGAMDLQTGYATPFGGSSSSMFCPWGDCDLSNPTTSPDRSRIVTTSGDPGRRINVDKSAWYAPRNGAAPQYVKEPANQVADIADPEPDQEFGLASHLDNVARVAYFSSTITDVYFGWEETEAYRVYPYRELDSWYWTEKTFDACGRVSGYTPLCREWYSSAVRAGGEVSFGDVLADPDNGQPFIGVSAAFYKNGQQSDGLVGVAAVSVGLKELKNTIENTELYENGYAYLYDRNGMAVIHPDWNTDMGPKKVADLAGAADAAFKDAYEIGVVRAFGTVGRWQGTWRNPDTGEGEVWYYSFRPIQNTPYQLVLGVSELEVELSAKELQEDLEALAAIQCTTTSIVMVATAVLLVVVSMLFQKRFIKPVQMLRDVITTTEQKGWRTEVDVESDVVSLELNTLRKNFRKLLTALRFNNPDYHAGNKALELQNLREAEAIVNETGNARGMGVCKNNLGNLVRGMDKHARNRLPPQDRDPRNLLKAAVQNARELANDPALDITEDTVGTRLLGLALARLDVDDQEAAVADLRDAIGIHKRSQNWQALARLAFVLACRAQAAQARAKASPDAPPADTMGSSSVDAMAMEAMSEAAKMVKAKGSEAQLQASDGGPLAQLCFCLSLFMKDSCYILWALNNILNLDKALVGRLAKQIQGDERVNQEAEALVRLSIKDTTPTRRKVICFCIDRTWTPILEVCIKSIKTIIADHVGPNDDVCMWGLGDGWLIRDTKKGNDGGIELLKKVDAAHRCQGKCMLYRGMLSTTEHLQHIEEDVSRWLVVLTDLVDLEGKNPKFRNSAVKQAVHNLPSGSTLAVIDTSAISGWEPQDQRWPAFKSNMREFVDEAGKAGSQGHLLVASDLEQLAAKFQEVGELMAEADLGEHL